MSTENARSGDSRLDQVIAGEYVLGVLSPEDRRKVEARLTLDRNFAAMVDHWQSNLLTVDTVPRRPSRRQAAKGSGASEAPGKPGRTHEPPLRAAIWDSASFWRGIAGVATLGLVAFGLSQSGVFSPPAARPQTTRLAMPGTDIALTAAYDAQTGHLQLAPMAATSNSPLGDSGSLELWMTEEGHAPVSLGVLSGVTSGDMTVPKAVRSRLRDGAALSISLEPAGGSPSGIPTGKVLAQGTAGRR